MVRWGLNAGCAVAALLAPLAAHAEDAAAPPAPAVSADQSPDQTYHQQPGPEIVVTGALQTNRQDMLSGVAVVQGSELTQALRPSIGETLEHTPGVSATSFGPTASRPVLRGFQGERVSVLNDGLGATSISFWLRRWIVHSRSHKWLMPPCLSPMICTSMCRALRISRST